LFLSKSEQMAQKYRNFKQTVNMRVFLIDNSVWAGIFQQGWPAAKASDGRMETR